MPIKDDKIIEYSIKKKYPFEIKLNISDDEYECLRNRPMYKEIIKKFGKERYQFVETEEDEDDTSHNYYKLLNRNAVWDWWGDHLFFKNKNDAVLAKLLWG